MKNTKLRGRIIERYGPIGAFAKALGLNKSNVSMKLNGHSAWTQKQIADAMRLLEIQKRDIGAYFF